MHNLLQCSTNYSDTTGSLWFYFKDKATNFIVDIENSKTLSIRLNSSISLNYWETELQIEKIES